MQKLFNQDEQIVSLTSSDFQDYTQQNIERLVYSYFYEIIKLIITYHDCAQYCETLIQQNSCLPIKINRRIE